MKRVKLSLLAFVCAAGALTVVVAPAGAAETQMPIVDEIDALRQATWRWQRLMGVRQTPALRHERWAKHEYRIWILDLWRKRAARAYHRALRPPHRDAWRCIHRHEGAWSDPDPPYWGGLQMDLSFQAHYGGHLLRAKGTADRWTPIEQMWVAEKAYRSGRGFYPWPNTARYCGLI
ncbi:MAG: hypothetical protein ABR583_11235 [Gaiellaceae bacterium]